MGTPYCSRTPYFVLHREYETNHALILSVMVSSKKRPRDVHQDAAVPSSSEGFPALPALTPLCHPVSDQCEEKKTL